MIIDGKVRRGSHNICGEIGYMMFEYTEETTNSGWLEGKINLKKLNEEFGISGSRRIKKKKGSCFICIQISCHVGKQSDILL